MSELIQPEVFQTHPEESLADAAARMRDHGVGSLAVLDGADLNGILTERDLLVAEAWAREPRPARPREAGASG